MYQLCQSIRSLTLQAAELVAQNEIEQCHKVLVKRQALLDQLMSQYQGLKVPDNKLKQTFIDLITWIQEQDAINNAKVSSLKERNQEDSMAQVKINKALHHYKNIT